MGNKKINAGILGTGSYLPEKILTNHDLEKMVDTSDEWITTRSGIKERRIVEGDMTTSEMSARAARIILEDTGTDPEEIDMIIVATVTGDYVFPASACIVQKKLGAGRAVAFDISAGCSGFVFASIMAESFIATGKYKRILVIGAESLSKIVDWTDRSTCVLFGDGAGAVLYGPVPEGEGILSHTMRSIGEKAEFLYQPAGGSALPPSLETVKNRQHYIHMNGSEIFKFGVTIVPKAAKMVVEAADMDISDVDYFLFHQANIRIIDAATKHLKVDPDKVLVNLDRLGNTSAASIPILLDEAVKDGRIRKGNILNLVGFGAGLTYGSLLMKWGYDYKGKTAKQQ